MAAASFTGKHLNLMRALLVNRSAVHRRQSLLCPPALAWLCLLLALGPGIPVCSLAAGLVRGPTVLSLSPTNAVVHWVTDTPCGTRVQLGTAPDKLDRRLDGPVTNIHTVTLTHLKPGTRCFFSVGTARHPLATNSFETPIAATPTAPGQIATVGPPMRPAKTAWLPPPAPPARETWGNYATLRDHFERHGRDVGARTADEYAALAWQFLERAKFEGLPMKQDDSGVLRVFDPKTRAFAAYNRNGTTRTFFKPQSRDYFDRQPGQPLTTSDLR